MKKEENTVRGFYHAAFRQVRHTTIPTACYGDCAHLFFFFWLQVDAKQNMKGA